MGLIQRKSTADRAANTEKLKVNIRKTVRGEAESVVLRELYNGLYFCQTEDTGMFDLTEAVPGPSMETFGTSAKESGIVLVLFLSEKRALDLHHSTVVVLKKDSIIAGKYHKIYILDDPVYCERFYFTPGDLGFKSTNTPVGRFDVLVCQDQWYSEAARLMAARGAKMLICPTVTGWKNNDTQKERDRQLDAWTTIQWGHAVANGPPIISANRIRHEPDPSRQTGGIWFRGNSLATGPQGGLLTIFPNDEEGVCMTETDKTYSENVRRWWPFFRDRRIDTFGGLTE